MSDRSCHWCRVTIRRVEVLVGSPPGRPVFLWLDVDPHPDGEVLERDDGKFRRLLPDQVAKVVKPLYRIHGNRTCGPGNQEQ